MTLQVFFEKFELFAEVPDTVMRMRQLILTLAVEGKLVRSSSASSWPSVSMAEVCAQITDGEHSTPPRTESGVPLATAKNVRDGFLDLANTDYVSESTAEKCWKRCRPRHNDLLMVCVGATTGRVCLIQNPPDMILVRSVALIRPNTELATPSFLNLFLRSPSGQKQIWENVKQSAQPCLYLGKMATFEINLPPIAEQKRIVAKVDELMALCDRLEAQQQERETRHAALARASLARFADAPTPANLALLFHPSYTTPPADLRKSILTLAVQGKLVRFDADHEDQTVGDHIEFQNGYAFKSEWFKPIGMRLCRNANVSHGVLDWRDSVFVDDKVATEFKRFALSEGDIVLSLDRPLITTGLKVARVRKADLPCLLLQRVARPFPKHDRLDMDFFLLWLKSSEFVDSIDPGRSNGVPHISTRQVQRLPFVLPPLAEQRRIVAKVDQLMALVDQLEAQLAESKAKAQKLLDAVIHELLNPRAEIIEFPRAAIGCYVIRRLSANRRFGKVMLMKLLYLSETHIARSFGGEFMRHAAGPWDPWIDQFEHQGKQNGWFKVESREIGGDRTKFDYRAQTGLDDMASKAALILGDQQPEFDRVLDLFSDKTTEEAEIIATLFAAWNDALIEGRDPDDEEVIKEVRENWHPEKARFTSAQLKRWLGWMREHQLVPEGRGRATLQQKLLPLH